MRIFDCSAMRVLLASLTLGAFLFCGNPLAAQRSKANSQQIDPVRVGDAVEVSKFRKWYPGTVVGFENGVAEIEYSYLSSEKTDEFPLSEIRYPNGEGGWQVWKAPKLEIDVEARYITRDEDSVMVRDAEGEEYEIPIKELSLQLKQLMKKIPIPGDENKIDGVEPFRVGDDVQVEKYSRWYDGVVQQMANGKIEVEYESSGNPKVEQFEFKDVKFPNGEGYWQMWKDESGKFEILARYAARTKTHVTLITDGGKKIEVPMEKLAFKFRKRLSKMPVTGSENLVKGVSPIRIGDLIEFKDGSYWQSGKVTDLVKGKAMIAYSSQEKDYSKAVDLDKITFANGQGPWMKWQDKSKEFSVIGRYLDRSDTDVKLLTETGKEVSLGIERLTPKLQMRVKQSISWTPLPEAVSFEKSPKRIAFMSSAPEFSDLKIDSSKTQLPSAAPVLPDGGFGFPMGNGNQISLAKPTEVDGWVAVGTYSDGKNSSYPITQLYWVDPAKGKLENGPGFPGGQRIVDYSSKQKRLLTSLMSTGSFPKAIGFCTYKATPGSVVAEPEYRLDLPESKSRYGSSTSYQATLLNEHHLLLARDSKLTLYDFQSATTVFELEGLAANQFQIHPSGKFVLVRQKDNGLSLYETATGSQVGFDGSASFLFSGFSQDGRRIVGIGPKFVYIWDMTGNAAAKKLPANNLRSGSEFGRRSSYGYRPSSTDTAAELLGDEWIWRDGLLYNTDKEMLVWNYRGANVSVNRKRFSVKKKSLVGEKVLVTATLSDRYSTPLALIGIAKVPHKKAIETMNQVDVEEMVMLKPGVGVRIETEGDARIRKAIEQAVAANEWTEDPNSKIIISGSAKLGESITENYEKTTTRSSYNPFRRPDPSNVITRTIRPWQQRIRISYANGTAWSRGESSYAPGGASSVAELDQKVREASAPKYSLFENLEFPKTLVYPSFKDGLGSSAITPTGFVDRVSEVPKEDEGNGDGKP